jgi:hypothetical protein
VVSFKISDESSKMDEYRQRIYGDPPLKSRESDLYNQHSLHASAKEAIYT